MKTMELTPTATVEYTKVAFVDKCKSVVRKFINNYNDFCKFVRPL
jgi:hypothetical protein